MCSHVCAFCLVFGSENSPQSSTNATIDWDIYVKECKAHIRLTFTKLSSIQGSKMPIFHDNSTHNLDLQPVRRTIQRCKKIKIITLHAKQ